MEPDLNLNFAGWEISFWGFCSRACWRLCLSKNSLTLTVSTYFGRNFRVSCLGLRYSSKSCSFISRFCIVDIFRLFLIWLDLFSFLHFNRFLAIGGLPSDMLPKSWNFPYFWLMSFLYFCMFKSWVFWKVEFLFYYDFKAAIYWPFKLIFLPGRRAGLDGLAARSFWLCFSKIMILPFTSVPEFSAIEGFASFLCCVFLIFSCCCYWYSFNFDFRYFISFKVSLFCAARSLCSKKCIYCRHSRELPRVEVPRPLILGCIFYFYEN